MAVTSLGTDEDLMSELPAPNDGGTMADVDNTMAAEGYWVQIAGLHSGQIQQITVVSNVGDQFQANLTNIAGGAKSSLPFVLVDNGGQPLSKTQQAQLLADYGINTIDPDVTSDGEQGPNDAMVVDWSTTSGLDSFTIPCAVGAQGHHWVPQAVYNSLQSLMTPEAYNVFKAGSTGEAVYNHGFDTWSKATHKQYNDAIESVVKNLAAQNNGVIDQQAAENLLTWIADGTVADANFLKANAESFATILKWRKGYLESIVVAQRGPSLAPRSRAELKSISKAVVNGESAGLSEAALSVLGKLRVGGTAALRISAKKVVPVLVVYSFTMAAAKGYSGEGRQGMSGVGGAAAEMARDAVCADLVEDIAKATADSVESFILGGKTLDQAEKDYRHKRFGDLLPD